MNALFGRRRPGTWAVAAFILPTCLAAQDAAAIGRHEPAKEPAKLEALVVTGSRIKRTEFEGPSPIRVLAREDIDRTAGSGLADVLRDLPEAASFAINENTTTAPARGVTALDLRSLGTANTLILVDGRRQAPNGVPFGTTMFVDLNRFPAAMIERVEVLKDGASAVYGADATAGVVNLILRKDYSGTEISGRYGNYIRTDGAETSWSLLSGRSSGRLQALLGLAYSSRNAIAAIDLPFTADADQTERWRAVDPVKYAQQLQPTATATSAFDKRSPAGPFATVFVPSPGQLAHPRNGLTPSAIRNPLTGVQSTFLPGTGGVPQGTLGANPGTAASVPRQSNPGRPSAAQFVPRAFIPGDFGNSYNYQELVWNTSETERRSANARLGYDLADDVSLHLTAAWMRQRSRTHLAPTPMGTQFDNAILVPASNYYNPFGIPVAFTYRSLELGPRVGNIVSDTFSVTAGAEGALTGRFEWDLAWSWSANEVSDTTDNYVRESKLRAALAASTPDAFNIFGGPTFRNAPATLESLRASVAQAGNASTGLLDLRLTTMELFSLPWGPVAGSASFEHRLERFNITNDPLISTFDDIIGTSRGFEYAYTRRDVQSAAAELRLPLVPPGRWWLGSAEVSGAARFERFSDGYDSGIKPFVGLRLRLGSRLLLRGSYGRVFRAPSLVQLYGGTIEQTVNGLADLRRPDALTRDSFDVSTNPRLVRTGGNPRLTPENGTTRQVGLVFDAPGRLLRGLSFEFTHGRIEQDRVIREGLGLLYIRQNEVSGTGDLVIREPGSETYTNTTGAPIAILSGPDGQTSLIPPGQSATVPGRITMILDAALNISYQSVQYSDFGLRWRRTIAGLGAFTLSSNWTYNEQFLMKATPAAVPTSSVGRSLPRYRSQSSLAWEGGRWSADASLHYNHRYRDLVRDGFEISRYYTVNLGLSRSFGDDVRLRVLRGIRASIGIENLLDREPPPEGIGTGFDQGFIGRPAGRFLFVSVRRNL